MGDICTLSHETPEVALFMTYDPSGPEYAITLTRPGQPWPAAPVFAMRFEGANGTTITTDRHQLGQDGRAVTVIDRGFGNVLDGLAFNQTTTAILGETEVTIPLDGAAGPVEIFRTCAPLPTA